MTTTLAAPVADTVPCSLDAEPHLILRGDNADVLPRIAGEIGLVDVAYLDPPYNTGKTEWLYQDAREDWGQFMRERLQLVRGMLAPDGAVAASIGHQQVHHLATLMAETFPRHRVHMITVEVSGGKPAGGIKQVAEYLLVALPEGFVPHPISWAKAGAEARQPWEGLTLSTAPKGRWPHQVYPVIVDDRTRRIVDVGLSLRDRVDLDASFDPYAFPLPQSEGNQPGTSVLWPVTRHGKECSWRLTRDAFLAALKRGHIKVDPTHMPGNPNAFSVKYLPAGVVKRIDSGDIHVAGRDENGALILDSAAPAASAIPTMWVRKEHHTAKGTARLEELIGANAFPYPKPVAFVRDVLQSLTGHNRDAVILDAFAGSGTTYEAIVELNAADDGSRRGILITNDEGGLFDAVTVPRVRAVTKTGAGRPVMIGAGSDPADRRHLAPFGQEHLH